MNESDLISSLVVVGPSNLPKYLKWKDAIVADVGIDNSFHFRKPVTNTAAALLSQGRIVWGLSEVRDFLSERIPSRERRDIEKILHSAGLNSYDVIALATRTRAFNAKDLFWLSNSEEEKFEDVVSDILKTVFIFKRDLEGEAIYSPEGVNVKRYGVYKGRYGIYKKRLNPSSSDVESEEAVWKIAKLLSVPCCTALQVESKDGREIFSEFEYNFSSEYILHFRRFVDPHDLDKSGGDLRKYLIEKFPQFKDDINKMVILDFLTRQTDRHLSNFAVSVSGGELNFYPLYDNGRSLFFEDTKETMDRALEDIILWSTEFGPVGTYADMILDMTNEGLVFSRLVDLSFEDSQIESILINAKIPKERIKGALQWVLKCKGYLLDLDGGNSDNANNG